MDLKTICCTVGLLFDLGLPAATERPVDETYCIILVRRLDLYDGVSLVEMDE